MFVGRQASSGDVQPGQVWLIFNMPRGVGFIFIEIYWLFFGIEQCWKQERPRRGTRR
jgi:hypothetical protein